MATPQLPDTERVRKEIAALVPDWPPAAIQSIAHLDGGFSNHNFRFRCDAVDYVIRVPGRERPYVDRRAELELLRGGQLSSDPALEAPSLIAFDPDTGSMITRWVDGQLLSEARPDEADLIGYLKRLHATLPVTSRTYDPLELSRQLLAGARGPRWLTRLLASLAWQPRKLVPAHNDLNPWNVIRTVTGTWLTL
ncbi:MAG: phosphotransferase, partial [Pseudomonadales bacterium]|nr:phosphotransferase [Pseudomonadales bacterium]